MKYIITILAVIGLFSSATAQNYNAKIADTTIVDAKSPAYILTATGPKKAVTFQYNITKNTGTVAGTIVLQGSIDGGTKWATLNTYTLTDATATTSVSYAYNGYVKYRVLITTSGTQNANYQVWALYRE